MKKILVLTSVLALAACGSVSKEMDAHFAGCERIDTTKEHLVYKCPSSQEWIVNLKNTQKPNAQFKMGGNIIWEEVIADTENTYVEVVLGDSAGCKESFHLRTIIKPINPKNPEEMYAFIGCK